MHEADEAVEILPHVHGVDQKLVDHACETPNAVARRQPAGIDFSTSRTQYDAPWPRILSLNV